MICLLDTDICVYWLRGHDSLRARLEAVDPASIAVFVVTLAELRYGAECSAQPEANHRAIDDFIAGILVWGIDDQTARTLGEIKAGLRRKGMLLEDFDLLLAAAARTDGLTLVTNNLAHFSRIDGLVVGNWIAN